MKKVVTPKKPIPQGKPATIKKTEPHKSKDPVKPPSRKADRYFVLFFFLFAFVLYGNTILNKYAIDDNFVTNNEVVVKGIKAIPHFFFKPVY